MATKPKGKGARQQAVRRARIAAAAEASRRQNRHKRWIVIAGVIILVIALVLGAFVTNRGGSSKSSASPPNCVAMTDTPPLGAPYVPVHVGPAPTTLVTQDLRVGTGPAVTPQDKITVNYIGVNCTDGKIFDDTYSRGQPFSDISLADVIPGWQQGIPGMQAGGQRLLGIPPSLGYGAAGRPGIGPNETLWFVVDLVSIDGQDTTTAPAESVPPQPGASDATTVPATPPPSS
jgi:peptidylprolyl isomerase